MDRSQLVIVALPSENDYVNKISSEKKPHLTLLYLGDENYDASQLELMMGYVQFAASMLPSFALDVEDRGELGPNRADVLFFNTQWTKEIVKFRDNLLRNDLVMTAYQSADQFPEWTPHLTLGYPESPAKKDPSDDREITYVSFDRIAFWTGESEGPEFKLKYPEHETEVAMSRIERGRSATDDVLSHFGIKGMKWGVRRSSDELKANNPPSEDHNAAKASAAKAKAAGIKSLSNKELKDLNERLNLEKNYKNLAREKKSKGQKAVEEILLNIGKQEASKILSKAVGKGTSALLKSM